MTTDWRPTGLDVKPRFFMRFFRDIIANEGGKRQRSNPRLDDL